MTDSYITRPAIEASDPFALFKEWFEEAEMHEPNDANAMSLATMGADGALSARIVLLKNYDYRGFCFFTNMLSRKGRQLKENPRAALCLHWKTMRRQVRIEGSVEPVTHQEADTYFANRPRGSQIGAWASLQSNILHVRTTLEERVAQYEKEFGDGPVPRPPHWSGYRVVPQLIEFWQDMPYRLHDRLIFTREGEGWRGERWYP